MSAWIRDSEGMYSRKGTHVLGLVSQQHEVWISRVYARGYVTDVGEWSCREDAFLNASSAMRRACWLRRFEAEAPFLDPDSKEETDDDDDR